jgi:RimJ/RimL family protein N-acetyltransferase
MRSIIPARGALASAAGTTPDEDRMSELATPRLALRQWRDADLAPFAALNADPEVMRYMPRCLERSESDALAGRYRERIAERGWDLWALERRDDGTFVGALGLTVATFPAPFAPCLEIAWRLAKGQWGQGLATEAAAAVLRFGFQTLALEEVLAFTVPANRRSRAVMQRLGMRHDLAADFEHPRLAHGHPLRPHVLYRLRRADWESAPR